MDWSKLDAGLAAEVANGEEPAGRYSVFVHLAGPTIHPERLAELGLDPAGGGRVRTATLSRADVDRLSEQAEVRRLVLSRSLRSPAGPEGGEEGSPGFLGR